MLRAIVATSLGAASAIFAFAAAIGLTDSLIATTAIALLAAGAIGALAYVCTTLDAHACSRRLFVVSGIATVLALVALGRLAVFMVDSSRVDFSSLPASTWETQHSCLSAYYVAGRAVSTTPNVYDESLYSLAGEPGAPRLPRKLGLFNIDVYEYPPPFLLLPRLIGLLTSDFARTRALWFGLTGALVLLAIVWVARAMGPMAGTRALLLSRCSCSRCPPSARCRRAMCR